MSELIGVDEFYFRIRDIERRHGGRLYRETDMLFASKFREKITCKDGYYYTVEQSSEWVDMNLFCVDRRAKVHTRTKFLKKVAITDRGMFYCYEQCE